jgi:putative acetyltransferase
MEIERQELRILIDDPRRPEAASFLREHLEDMTAHGPAESCHALDIDGLSGSTVTFWTASAGPQILGCGALMELDSTHGEIKSMRIARDHRRRGVGAQILERMIDEAMRRSYARLSLETGSMASFSPAREFFARFGFEDCEPFASYQLDANSVFMTRAL